MTREGKRRSLAGPRAAWFVLLLTGTLAGCRYTPPSAPEALPTVPVSGLVTCGGMPVSGGWVNFVPRGATVGNYTTIPIGPDGRFPARLVPRGLVAIQLDIPELHLPAALPRSPLLDRRRQLLAGMHTPLLVDLGAASNPQLEVEMLRDTVGVGADGG